MSSTGNREDHLDADADRDRACTQMEGGVALND